MQVYPPMLMRQKDTGNIIFTGMNGKFRYIAAQQELTQSGLAVNYLKTYWAKNLLYLSQYRMSGQG